MARAFTKLTAETLPLATTALCRREARFQVIVQRHGTPSLRTMPEGLTSILHIVTEQFLSLQAAHAIWSRLQARLSPITPEIILACQQQDLKGLGLSTAKARHFHAIAQRLSEEPAFLEALSDKSDELVRQALQTLPGVGPWTAEIYLLSALQRSDAWPAGDLALRLAAADLFGLAGPPDVTSMQGLGAAFSPWRAVAARLLWSHYRSLKRLPQAS